MRCTDQQFMILAKLLRSPPSLLRCAAQMILVGGATNNDAKQKFTPLTRQQISGAVKRFTDAHSSIVSAYGNNKPVDDA